jgi:hypothetical protein
LAGIIPIHVIPPRHAANPHPTGASRAAQAANFFFFPTSCIRRGRSKVLFSQYAGAKVKVEGDELLMMGEDDILAVIED